MRWQKHEWSCGSAATVNALKHFGIVVSERSVIPIAGTIDTAKCKHCNQVDKLIEDRTCKKSSHWKCSCKQCLQIRRVWGSDCDAGTTEQGILTAIKHFGRGHGIAAATYESESKNDAWQWLHGSLLHGRVVVLCIDRWSHWVLAIGGAGDRVVIFDSYPSKKNLACNGIHVLTNSELMRRWWNGTKWVGKEKRLYAISVGQ